MAHKLYDLAVKVGEYTDGQGRKKGRWHNVGAVMETDDGGKFIMLDRCFNPAGVPNPEGRSTILLSMFEPRDDAGRANSTRPATQRQTAPQRTPQQEEAPPPMEDDIPF